MILAVKLFMSGVRPISTYAQMLLCEQAPTQHLGICVCMAELFNFILSSAAGGLCGLSAAFFCLIIYAFIKSFPIYCAGNK